jgi:hypothetical protein
MIDKNKKLAGFLGQENQPYEFPQFGYVKTNGDWKDEFLDFQLKFDKDWNWLMLVVHRIEQIVLPDTDNCFNVTIGAGLYCVIQDAYGELVEITGDGATKMLAVHEACVKFLDWYELQR